MENPNLRKEKIVLMRQLKILYLVIKDRVLMTVISESIEAALS